MKQKNLKFDDMDEQTLERIYPTTLLGDNINTETFKIHLDRYKYAASMIIRGGTIADIACGAGYGSFLLVNEIEDISIVAVDNNKTAIEYARKHFANDRIEYIVSDAMKFTSGKSLSSIVCLETIEHLPDPGSFVKHITAQLSSGGRIIASAPVTPSMDANMYHLQDFTTASFKNLFTSCNLIEIDSFHQKQNFNPLLVLRKKTERSEEVRKNLPRYYFKNPGKFWLRIKSIFKDGFRNKYLTVVFEKP